MTDTRHVKCEDCGSELNVEQEKLTTCPHCYGGLKEPMTDTAIQHLRDSPGVQVVEQERPHDPREIYDIYVDLPVFPGHEITDLYEAGFEVSVDFSESKLIAATQFEKVEDDDSDE